MPQTNLPLSHEAHTHIVYEALPSLNLTDFNILQELSTRTPTINMVVHLLFKRHTSSPFIKAIPSSPNFTSKLVHESQSDSNSSSKNAILSKTLSPTQSQTPKPQPTVFCWMKTQFPTMVRSPMPLGVSHAIYTIHSACSCR